MSDDTRPPGYPGTLMQWRAQQESQTRAHRAVLDALARRETVKLRYERQLTRKVACGEYSLEEGRTLVQWLREREQNYPALDRFFRPWAGDPHRVDGDTMIAAQRRTKALG